MRSRLPLRAIALLFIVAPAQGFCVPARATTTVTLHLPRSEHRRKRLAASPVDADSTARNEIRNIVNDVSRQTLSSLVSQSDLKQIYNELFFERSSVLFNDETYQQYKKYWSKAEIRLRQEDKRTLSDLLGEEATSRILNSIRGDEGGVSLSYDAQSVRTFLESDAINSLFTKLLYDAIFEFTINFDILGNAISKLPMLGPVRQQVLKESKRQMDRTLGPLLQRFLSSYTRIAIGQTLDFVISAENSSAFGKANARLVEYLLKQKTLADFIPEDTVLVDWREESWKYLAEIEDNESAKEDLRKILEQSIDFTYDALGDKCIQDSGLDVNEILDSSPTLERGLVSFWERCKESASSNPKVFE